ncbi:hypothetical protein IKQ26_07365, partial [bacterium]|nr:hypothetical protein [bacterium]
AAASEPVCSRKFPKRLKIFDFQKRSAKFSSCQNPRQRILARAESSGSERARLFEKISEATENL